MENSQADGVIAEDYAALTRRLKHYPQITIISTEKEPPETYVIEYKLFGYGYNDKGAVEVRRRHRVQIDLPFGYPHFPPTVKPLTTVCHPDVDEHAVRIADQWQRNQSLADLVIYIADMIRGEMYSRDAAFNQEAAEWYAAQQAKLPLAELKYILEPDKVEEKGGAFFAVFLKRLVLTAGVLVTLAIAAVYYHDMIHVRGAENALREGRAFMAERQFIAAREEAERALGKLDRVLMLDLDKEEQALKLRAFLDSRDLREGLEGKVVYNGLYYPFVTADLLKEIGLLRASAISRVAEGDLEGAVAEFDAAMQLAEENELQDELQALKAVSAETRLRSALAAANSNYKEGKWENAANSYDEVATIIETERRVLPEKTLGTLGKIKKLRLLARVNKLKEEAVAAEQRQDYEQAADYNRTMALLISRSGFRSDEALGTLQAEAVTENARLREQVQVDKGSKYLVHNYQDIFTKHYPGLERDGLKSPKVKYLGRSSGNFVFIMSCIELVQRKATEYRLYYQFNPGTSQWSLYTKKRL